MALTINYTTGYAGTGKSHKLIELVDSLNIESTVVIAPTHKALARLRSHLPQKLEIKTIHSLLGWIPSINEKAQKVEHIDSTYKLDKDIEAYSNIIIDEAGMMSEDMFYSIISKLEDITTDLTIECFLDPYQLLPVKGQQIQTDPETTTNLTTQYRAESTDVVELYTKFVQYIEGINSDDLTTPYSDNVLPLDINKFKQGDRLLAYTNKAVGEWNKKIAKVLGIDNYINQEVQLGSMVDTIVCEEFISPTINGLLSMYGVSLKLQNSNINSKYLEANLQALLDNENILFMTATNGFTYPVIVGVGNANKVIKQAKQAAIKNRAKFKDIYALGRAYTMDYTFATTVHKSQGSEFSTVFIDKADIQKSIMNNYYDTYARLMYVAISRAKHIIYI